VQVRTYQRTPSLCRKKGHTEIVVGGEEKTPLHWKTEEKKKRKSGPKTITESPASERNKLKGGASLPMQDGLGRTGTEWEKSNGKSTERNVSSGQGKKRAPASRKVVPGGDKGAGGRVRFKVVGENRYLSTGLKDCIGRRWER